jgi:hypothetical protein
MVSLLQVVMHLLARRGEATTSLSERRLAGGVSG